GDIILNAPAGYEFDAGGSDPTVRIQKISGSGNSGNANGGKNNVLYTISSRTTTQISFTITNSSSGTSVDSFTWGNIRMRALVGSPLGSGTITNSGTSTQTAVTPGVTSWGNVHTVAGVVAQFVIQTEPSSNAVAGVTFVQQPVVGLQDQFGNPCLTDSATVVTAVRNQGTDVLQAT